MNEWKKITQATPRDKRLLLFGQLRQPFEGLRVSGPEIFSGYWDEIDSTWCGSGTTANGPFYDATHWMELPEPPITHAALRKVV